MRFGHLAQALESEIVFRHPVGWMRRAKASLGMAAVNPGRGQSGFVRREVIVKQAFGGMEDLVLLVPRTAKFLDQVFKVARIRLV